MKDLFEAINTRVKEPYWGFFLLSFFAFNWRGLFLLCLATGTAQERVNLFDSETNFWSLLFLPIVTSLIILLITPWLKVIFGYATRSAYERINSQELKRESKYLAEKNSLEKERSRELANKEKELIDQAMRDEDIEKIKDTEVKENLKKEIDDLRTQRNIISHEDTKIIGRFLKVEEVMVNFLRENDNNYIEKNRSHNGDYIRLGDKIIYREQDLRNFLKYEEAIKSLVKNNILQDINNKGMIFEMAEDDINL